MKTPASAKWMPKQSNPSDPMPLTKHVPIGTDVMRAIGCLCERDIVLLPTENEYVLACNALDKDAVERLLSFRSETEGMPVEILLPSAAKLNSYAKQVPESIAKMAGHFPPGRVTFLLPRKYAVSDRLTSGGDKVAFSVASHPLALAVLDKFHFPLAVLRFSPHHTWESEQGDYLDRMAGRIGYVLDGGATVVGPGSTWVEMGDDCILVHRIGAVSREELERVTGLPTLQQLSPITRDESVLAVPSSKTV